MNYIQHVNGTLRARIEAVSTDVVVFGQNVAAGSKIGGLAAGLTPGPRRTLLNTPNVENAEVGIGLGLMLQGVSSVFVMKQQDFLLLGLDQMTNTYNIVRGRTPNAFFSIVTIIVDSGYEGPQSCYNGFSDICSMARVPGYVATNKIDVERIFSSHLTKPGFRVFGVSQRLFRQPVIEPPGLVSHDAEMDILGYARGDDVTIAAFNCAFPQALQLHDALERSGMTASLFSVNAVLPASWGLITDDVRRTGRLVVLDDSKSVNRTSDRLIAESTRYCPRDKIIAATRPFSEDWFRPNSDIMAVDIDTLVAQLAGTFRHNAVA
jgi:pyruvate dehydrogenase E1 component beta subunit